MNHNHTTEQKADWVCQTAGEMVEISDCIQHHFEVYLNDLDTPNSGMQPDNMYQMMLNVCEKPLLEWVMSKTRNNQSLASQWLGLNRATLRKKLQQHKLI